MRSGILKVSFSVVWGFLFVALLLQACQPNPAPVAPPATHPPANPVTPTPTPIPLDVDCDDLITITSKFSLTQNSVTPTPSAPITAPQHIIFLIDESLSMYSLCTPDNADLRFYAPMLLISLLQAQKTITEQKLIQVDVYGFSTKLRRIRILTDKTVEQYNKDLFDILRKEFENKPDNTKNQNNFNVAFDDLLKLESSANNKPLVILISDGWTKGGSTTQAQITEMQTKYDLRMIRPVCTGNSGERTFSNDADWNSKNYMSDANKQSRESDNTLWNGIVLKSAEVVDYAAMQPEDWLKALLLEEHIQQLLTYKNLYFYTQGNHPIEIHQESQNPIWYLSLKTVQFGMETPKLSPSKVDSIQDKINRYIFTLNWYREPNNNCTDTTLPELITSANENRIAFGVYWIQQQNILSDFLNIDAAKDIIFKNTTSTTTLKIENNQPRSMIFDIPPLLVFDSNISSQKLLAPLLEQSINQCYNLVVRIGETHACKVPLPSQRSQATIELSEQSQRTDIPVLIGLAQFEKPNGKRAAFWQVATLTMQYRFSPRLARPYFKIDCTTSPCTATIYLQNLQNSSPDYKLKIRFLATHDQSSIPTSQTAQPGDCFPETLDDMVYILDDGQVYYRIGIEDIKDEIPGDDNITLNLLDAYNNNNCKNNDIEYIFLRWETDDPALPKKIDIICRSAFGIEDRNHVCKLTNVQILPPKTPAP